MDICSLKFLIILPLIAVIITVSPFISAKPKRIKNFSILMSLFNFIYSTILLVRFAPDVNGFALKGKLLPNWLESFGINFSIAVDSLSIWLVVLTAFLVFISVVISKNTICSKQKLYYSMIFLLEFSLFGVFSSRDMFAFFMFWELAFVPLYFLLSFWNNNEKNKQEAVKFLLYSVVSGFFILFGILCVYYSNLDTAINLTGSMNLIDVGNSFYPQWFKYVMFACFFVGFGIRLPLIPIHGVLAKSFKNAPPAVGMLLSGIILNMGIYGLIRFNIQIFPEIFEYVAPILILLGVINIVFSFISVLGKDDLRQIIFHYSITNMGIILIGLASLNSIGFQGAIFQMIAFAIISAGIFLCISLLNLRNCTLKLSDLTGFYKQSRPMSLFFMLILLAVNGLPLLAGFPGMFMALLGLFLSDFNVNFNLILTAIVFVVIALSSKYAIEIFHNILYRESTKNLFVEKLSKSEIFGCSLLAFLIVALGIVPLVVFKCFDASVYLISGI